MAQATILSAGSHNRLQQQSSTNQAKHRQNKQCLGSILLGDTYKMAQPTTFTKAITSRGASYQKTLCPQAEEVSPRQVSDQKNLY